MPSSKLAWPPGFRCCGPGKDSHNAMSCCFLEADLCRLHNPRCAVVLELDRVDFAYTGIRRPAVLVVAATRESDRASSSGILGEHERHFDPIMLVVGKRVIDNQVACEGHHDGAAVIG